MMAVTSQPDLDRRRTWHHVSYSAPARCPLHIEPLHPVKSAQSLKNRSNIWASL
jgi:hypothetical protein